MPESLSYSASTSPSVASQKLEFVSEPVRFGRYDLLGRLGRGGMAEVFLALMSGPAGFQKLLVIKQLHEHLQEDDEFLEMFLDEARLAARLQHPNVVQTHEVGEAGGRHFIAMEYLDGQDLGRIRKRCKKRADVCPMELSVTVASRVLEGLHYAHELADYDGTPLGIIHRDVSPQNILVTYGGEVKVLDFGVAKAATQVGQTRAGVIKGKFSYISPERARGKEVDQRDDLWSVGVILWECLSGQRLFKAPTDVGTLSAVLEAKIPPLAEVAPNTPQPLIDVVGRALSPRVEDRYSTALEMRNDLEAFLATRTELRDHRAIGELIKGMFVDSYEKRQLALRAWLKDSQPSQPSRPSRPAAAPLPTFDETRPSSVPSFEPSPMGAVAGTPPSSPSQQTLAPPPYSAATPLPGSQNESGGHKGMIVVSALLVLLLIAVAALAAFVVFGDGSNDDRIAGAAAASASPIILDPVTPTTESPAAGADTAESAAPESDEPQPGATAGNAADNAASDAPGNEPTEPAGADDTAAVDDSVPATAAPAAARGGRPRVFRRPSGSGSAIPAAPAEPEAPQPGPEPDPYAAEEPAAEQDQAPEPRAAATTAPAESPDEEIGFGYLSFDTVPWSRISIGGRSYGSTPLLRVRLPAGTHTLRAVNPETGASAAYPVVITANQTTTRRIGL